MRSYIEQSAEDGVGKQIMIFSSRGEKTRRPQQEDSAHEPKQRGPKDRSLRKTRH